MGVVVFVTVKENAMRRKEWAMGMVVLGCEEMGVGWAWQGEIKGLGVASTSGIGRVREGRGAKLAEKERVKSVELQRHRVDQWD